MNEIESEEKILNILKRKLELSDNAKIEKMPVFKEMWTPIDVDMVIRDNYRLYFIEIKSNLRFENISRLTTFRELLRVKDKKNLSNYNFIIAGKNIPPKIKDLADTLNIKLINLPKKIEISKPKYDIFPNRVKVSSEKSWKIVSSLLKEKVTSIRQLSLKENVSYGWTYTTIQHLINQGIVEKKENYVELKNIDKLLNGIAWERPFENLKIFEMHIGIKSSYKAAKEISHILRRKKIKFAFTSYTAGGLYTGYAIRLDSIYLYLKKENLDFLKEIFDISPIGGIKAQIYMPDRDVFSNTRLLEDIKVVSPSQALLDLVGLGYGGRDLALSMVDKYASL